MPLAEPVSFEVVPLRKPTLMGVPFEEYQAFSDQLSALRNQSSALSEMFSESKKKINAMEKALEMSSAEPGALNEDLYLLKQELYKLEEKLDGNASKDEIGERNAPTIGTHLRVASRGLSTTYGPTDLHKSSLLVAKKMLKEAWGEVEKLSNVAIPEMEKALRKVGAPYILGQPIKKD
jgi:chromosome segregation ATPase